MWSCDRGVTRDSEEGRAGWEPWCECSMFSAHLCSLLPRVSSDLRVFVSTGLRVSSELRVLISVDLRVLVRIMWCGE